MVGGAPMHGKHFGRLGERLGERLERYLLIISRFLPGKLAIRRRTTSSPGG